MAYGTRGATRRSAAAASPPDAAASTPSGVRRSSEQPRDAPESTETATIVVNSSSSGGESDEEFTLPSPSKRSSKRIRSRARRQQKSVLETGGQSADEVDTAEPLEARIPQTKIVLDEVRKMHNTKMIFTNSEFFQKKSDQDIFFNSAGAGELWSEVSSRIVKAITKFTPKVPKDVEKKSKRFELEKRNIRQNFINMYELFRESGEEGEDGKYAEMTFILPLIGIEFMSTFQKLITPPGGRKRVPICEQVEGEVDKAIRMDLSEFFDAIVAQHVYYVVGFFCNAGAKEAERRTKENELGECIQAINQHFAIAREEDKVMEIKAELPAGLTDLVDRRCAWGGLKYPDLKLYNVFAVMERVFSQLTNTVNFTLFGGTLMTDILHEILHNSKVLGIFSDLFSPGQFSEETISSALRYYLKVFGNVRSKDVCYRMNSNIVKGATVGLRQRLAVGKGGKKGKKGKAEKKRKATTADTPDTLVKIRVGARMQPKKPSAILPRELRLKWGWKVAGESNDGGKKGEGEQPVQIRGGNIGDEDDEEEEEDDDNDEPEIYDEEEVDEMTQHSELQKLAEQDYEENEDYRKDCFLDEDTEEYMGETTTLQDEND